MKLEIEFTSRIVGAIRTPDTMKAIVDTSVCADAGGIIANLYQIFPAREHFHIQKAWRLTDDNELVPINLDQINP